VRFYGEEKRVKLALTSDSVTYIIQSWGITEKGGRNRYRGEPGDENCSREIAGGYISYHIFGETWDPPPWRGGRED